jgi:steroid delta-isomerase-like uncharacterized protein
MSFTSVLPNNGMNPTRSARGLCRPLGSAQSAQLWRCIVGSDENKQLARRFYEILNSQKLELLDEVMSEGFVEHGASGDEMSGIESFKEFLKMVTGAFPDLRVHVDDVVAEGNKVAVRLTVQGTHEGVLMGQIQSTGKHATWTGIDLLEIDSGKIVGRWNERNLYGLMQQLGVM